MVPSFNDRSSSVTKSNTAAQIKFPKHEPCKWSFQHDSHSDVGDSAGFINFVIESVSRTRLHSSRMRTARLLPVSTSMHYGGVSGGTCLWSGGCLPLVWSRVSVSQHEMGQTRPCEQNDGQVQKYYLAPNFVCGK